MVTGPSSDSVPEQFIDGRKMSDAEREEVKNKIKKTVNERGWVGAANTTKWNELLTLMREKTGWKPRNRTKWVSGYVSDWEGEWWHHLPFPFVGVQWLDLECLETDGSGTSARVIRDHSSEIVADLKKIGFEFEKVGDVVRIWGYLPKSYDGLEV